MRHRTSRAAALRRRRIIVLSLMVLGLAIVACVVPPSLVSTAVASGGPPSPPHLKGEVSGVIPTALGAADGIVPDGADVSVFDDHAPAVTKLDPDLLGALRRAATAADKVGVEFRVNSGWRSARYQQELLQQAVAKYGSLAQAERWVATPATSAHVSGHAVDIGPARAATWLSGHGAAYGLCQIYRNEPWHFELRPEAITQRCPRMYADPTQDPRMGR